MELVGACDVILVNTETAGINIFLSLEYLEVLVLVFALAKFSIFF